MIATETDVQRNVKQDKKMTRFAQIQLVFSRISIIIGVLAVLVSVTSLYTVTVDINQFQRIDGRVVISVFDANSGGPIENSSFKIQDGRLNFFHIENGKYNLNLESSKTSVLVYVFSDNYEGNNFILNRTSITSRDTINIGLTPSAK